MNHDILLGAEAVARGAVDAGISAAYAYPGTPSTEIFETILELDRRDGLHLHARWSANEKVALEEALGMSYAGRRALVSFKHVGLNVAADPFLNSALTGAHGGLVIAVADDPSMHSSQNEQDSRFYADFANVPCLEPSSQQEAYEMAVDAFDVSERLKMPVMLRLTTRLAHSRAVVTPRPRRAQNVAKFTDESWKWTLLPSNARKAFDELLAHQVDFQAWSQAHPANQLTVTGQGRPGIVASGIAIGYVKAALAEKLNDYNLLHIGAYPIPEASLRSLVASSSALYVFEEGYPLIERLLVGIGRDPSVPVYGRLSGLVPRAGELNADKVKRAFGLPLAAKVHVPAAVANVMQPRAPVLCEGCPHTDSYRFLNEVMAEHPGSRVMGDIGCYTLGYYAPHNGIQSCVCMGASIGMASGVVHAGLWPVVCVLGDSTFTHSGLPPLLDAIREDTDMTVMILDNSIVAMTGGQETLVGETDKIVKLVKGLGANPDHIHVLSPLPKAHEQNVALLRQEVAHRGLSVIVASRACVTYAKQIKENRRHQGLPGMVANLEGKP
jgi:indolepyruvate ferredoxin oxidoreductase alpha subunit